MANLDLSSKRIDLLPFMVVLLIVAHVIPFGSCVDEDCNDFLPWLGNKAGGEISSLLSIGKSAYGRALYATKDIQTGDCLLKVPYSTQLAPDNLPPEIACLLGDEVGDVAKVALLILYEKHLGKKSEWAPYISRLPLLMEMHSSVFWSDEELEMIRQSALYEETLKQKKQIEKDFLAVQLVSDDFPEQFQHITLQDFTYAYGLVTSRAWVSSRGVSMIPFADFLNHDGTSDSYVLSDAGRQHSEVIADRDFAPGDEVLIRYGKFSNATLLLDFGFTVSCNRYDQVRVELNVPQHDALYTQKLEILGRDRTPRIKDDNEFTYYENSFTVKKVGGGSRWGKGIPQSLRAFARIMACDSQQELHDLAKEAAENDGRLARKPLKNKSRELAAHQLLLSEMSRLIKDHDEHIKSRAPTPPTLREKSALRQKLALDLLSGELRVLKSASAWLESYCSRL
ncbi:hypothetical protein SASPL_127735 [Salvia splendens]|uniref:SET domain-containing protein n=1 Tax=Salvia splendens TaxID=180675 RepID=A0A8X8ZM62_SALSN|nr:hypothetical protein SASPL_127735 [Salvia splendens]